MCGICVADQSVYSSVAGRYCAMTPRGSIAFGISRCWRKRSLTVTAPSEDALDVAALELPGEAVVRAEVVVEDRRAVGERLLGVDHGRERVVLDLDELGGVLRLRARLGEHDGDAVALVAALSVASGRCIGCFVSSVTSQTHGSVAAQSSARSAPEKAATPSASRAADVDALDRRVRVGAADDRRPHHPGTVRSSMKRDWPVRSFASSLRATGFRCRSRR